MDLKGKLARLSGIGGRSPTGRIVGTPDPVATGPVATGPVPPNAVDASRQLPSALATEAALVGTASSETGGFRPPDPSPVRAVADAAPRGDAGSAPGEASSRVLVPAVAEPAAALTTSSPAEGDDDTDPAVRHAERLKRALQTLRPPSQTTAAAKPTTLLAEARQTPHGLVHVRETLFPAEHRHGRAPVAGALEAAGDLVSALALDPQLAEVDFTRMLLLDTETTGLAGGTGTLPFVVGIGWFDGGRLCVQQFVLRRPGEEMPILRAFEERLQAASCLVTYNGKTFDWPLLRSRFVMNRLKPPAPAPHLDLLHCTRRVFRHRPGGAKLVHIESEVLGHRRVGDVPGDQIPELYFRYLRSGQGHLLTPVLEHNAHDMVLLAALLGELVRQFRDHEGECDPRDRLGYASVAARAGHAARALSFARSAAQHGDDSLSAEALSLAAQISRREGDLASAVAALLKAASVARGERLAKVHLELSKLHEHRLRDLPRALEHARHTIAAEGEDAHRKRVARLERRLGSRPPGGSLPLLP